MRALKLSCRSSDFAAVRRIRGAELVSGSNIPSISIVAGQMKGRLSTYVIVCTCPMVDAKPADSHPQLRRVRHVALRDAVLPLRLRYMKCERARVAGAMDTVELTRR